MPLRRLWASSLVVALFGAAAMGDVPTSPDKADRMSSSDMKSGNTESKPVQRVAKKVAPPQAHPTVARLLDLHNQTRARVGLPPLALNQQMCGAAQRHANWMASSGAFTHSGLPYRENIAHGQSSPEHAVQSWTNSPGHYTNMCSGRECGFGYQVRGGTGYWVAVFR